MIALGFRRSPIGGYLALLAISETYRLAIGGLGLGTSFLWINQLPAFLDGFGAGMFAAYALIALRARGTVDARRATVLAVGAGACVVAGLAATGLAGEQLSADAARSWLNGHRIVIGPLCLVLALSVYFSVAQVRAAIAPRALVFLSAISYNLYLWHLEITVWVHNTGLPGPFAYVLSVAAAVLFASLVTYWIERPILQADLREIRRALIVRWIGRQPDEVLERAA